MDDQMHDPLGCVFCIGCCLLLSLDHDEFRDLIENKTEAAQAES